jgi:hypothetical protein
VEAVRVRARKNGRCGVVEALIGDKSVGELRIAMLEKREGARGKRGLVGVKEDGKEIGYVRNKAGIRIEKYKSITPGSPCRNKRNVRGWERIVSTVEVGEIRSSVNNGVAAIRRGTRVSTSMELRRSNSTEYLASIQPGFLE